MDENEFPPGIPGKKIMAVVEALTAELNSEGQPTVEVSWGPILERRAGAKGDYIVIYLHESEEDPKLTVGDEGPFLHTVVVEVDCRFNYCTQPELYQTRWLPIKRAMNRQKFRFKGSSHAIDSESRIISNVMIMSFTIVA